MWLPHTQFNMRRKALGNAASYLIATMAIMSMSITMLSFVGPGKINQNNEQNTVKTMLNEIAENHLNDTEADIQGNSEIYFQTSLAGTRPGWNAQAYEDTKRQLKTYVVPLPTTDTTSVMNRINPNIRQRDEVIDYNGQQLNVRSVLENESTSHLHGLKRFITQTSDKAMLVTVTTTITTTGQSIRKSRLVTLSDESDCMDDTALTPVTTRTIDNNNNNNYIPTRQASNYFQIGNQQTCDGIFDPHNASSTAVNCTIIPTLEPYSGSPPPVQNRNFRSYLISANRSVIPEIDDVQWVTTTLEVDPAGSRGFITTRIRYSKQPDSSPLNKVVWRQIYGAPLPYNALSDLDKITPLPAELANDATAPKAVGKYVKNIFIPAKTPKGTNYNVIMFVQSDTIATSHVEWRINDARTTLVRSLYTSTEVTGQSYSFMRPLLATPSMSTGGPNWDARLIFNPATDTWAYNSSSGILAVATTSRQYRPDTGTTLGPSTAANAPYYHSGGNIYSFTLDLYRTQFMDGTHYTPFVLRSSGADLLPSSTFVNNGVPIPKTDITAFRELLVPDSPNGTLLFTANYRVGATPYAGVFSYNLLNRLHYKTASEFSNTTLLMGFTETTPGTTLARMRGQLLTEANNIKLFNMNGTPHWIVSNPSPVSGLKSSQYIYSWNPNRWATTSSADFESRTGLGTSNARWMAGDFGQVKVIGPLHNSAYSIWGSADKPEIVNLESNVIAIRSNTGLTVVGTNGYQSVSTLSTPATLSDYGSSMQYIKPFLYFSAQSPGGPTTLYRYNAKLRQTPEAVYTPPHTGSIPGHGGLVYSPNLKLLYFIDTAYATTNPSFNTAARIFSPGCRKRQSIAGEFEGFTKVGLSDYTSGGNTIRPVQWSDTNPEITIRPARGDVL